MGSAVISPKKLGYKLRDKVIISSFSEANSLHKNFYENELTREIVEKMAEDVEQLIAKFLCPDATSQQSRGYIMSKEDGENLYVCNYLYTLKIIY